MKTFQTSQTLRSALLPLRKKNKKIGFVPTMGSLHEGHLSLVRLAKKENDTVVVSIFVNPLQFGPKEDLKKYPRDLLKDTRLLGLEKTDFLYAPNAKEFYPKDFQTSVSLSSLPKPLCGISRPTHFSGVATVVLKLLNNVMPDTLYLGQKDYLQFRVVEQMVIDLSFSCDVKAAPIIREPDGLAMSSRNVFLTPLERKEAPLIHQSLAEAARQIRAGVTDASKIKQSVRGVLKRAPLAKLDYLEIVDAETLVSVLKLQPGTRILVAIAAYFGKTRLIDNLLIRT